MVGMMTTFASADFQTPHGGAPFQGWRKGFGFGHAKGPGGYSDEPSIVKKLRYTPNGDRGLACSAFWRTKWELGPAASLGIGERPDYGNPRDADIGPNTYGDVSPQVRHVKANTIRHNICLKPRFPSIEEKQRDLSWPQCGPGPGKYNTCTVTGKSSLCRGARNPSWSLGPRIIMQGDLAETLKKPGPSEYNVVTTPGKNSPILRGTLYDISLKGRTKIHQLGENSPGPARYLVQGDLDKYGLLTKIQNTKVPKKKKDFNQSSLGSITEFAHEAEFIGETQGDRSLTRIESSPI
eukprot:TRINITY_DN78928_c0_g1_i1.p1 TRINITY_DN78928_c0_g1~~TRINITY_DN78928_c0_g1_i1.p1  ORF type:complete len:294 (+),score=44.31 TRINITY_DN78928_c0_g1_i1:83-964(+)